MSPLYALPTYDDVPEPTAEDLREIDEALDVYEPPVQMDNALIDWYRSAPVRAAVIAAGDPDGTAAWFATFTDHLLGFVDAAEALPKDLVQLVCDWDVLVCDRAATYGMSQGNGEGVSGNFWQSVPSEIPRRLMSENFGGRHIGFEACARLLRISVRDLERVCWPNTSEQLRRAVDAMLLDQSQTFVEVAKQFHVNKRAVALWMQWHEQRPRRFEVAPIHFAAALTWVSQGASRRAAHRMLLANGWCPASYTHSVFNDRVTAFHKAAAVTA